MSPTTEENARILLLEIREALARGTRHYNEAGELLQTPEAIIKALLREGGVTFEPAAGTMNATSRTKS